MFVFGCVLCVKQCVYGKVDGKQAARFEFHQRFDRSKTVHCIRIRQCVSWSELSSVEKKQATGYTKKKDPKQLRSRIFWNNVVMLTCRMSRHLR